METVTQPEEQNMLQGVKEAVDLVDNQGHSPNEAMTKVAREYQWTRGALRSAVSAFNSGRQTAQWKANDSVLDKLAEFPLADFETIRDSIWGGNEKQALDAYRQPGRVSTEYNFPPAFVRDPVRDRLRTMDLQPLLEKAAADGNPPNRDYAADPWTAPRKAWNAHQRTKRAFEETRTKYALAHDNVRVYVKMLEGYFKKAAMDRLPFAVVEHAASTYHGEQGRALFNLLARSCPKEKRAADSQVFHNTPLLRDQPPFSWVAKAIQAAGDVFHTKQAMDVAAEAMEKTAADMRPFVQAPPRPSRGTCSICLIEKDASVFDALGGAAMKGMMDQALGGDEAAKSKDKAWTELESPEHENELRKIRTQAMLNGMLSDPENPVSGYDPDEVLGKYNEIADLTPRTAEHPAALQPLLMQRLAGQTQPFEVKENLDIEKGLRDSKNPSPMTRSLLDAPQSLLG